LPVRHRAAGCYSSLLGSKSGRQHVPGGASAGGPALAHACQTSSVCEAAHRVARAPTSQQHGGKNGASDLAPARVVKHRECGRWQGERVIIVRFVGGVRCGQRSESKVKRQT
jgi:hypothetical protein